MSGEALYNKYRPQAFAEVIGQKAAVAALLGRLSEGNHSYLFTGPSGTGKTTLARLSAKYLGCKPHQLIEVDAATHSGVDEVRALTEGLQYRPFAGEVKAYIIDECHSLSKNAWQALLKNLEEPPDWVYWFLCTTEATKVPETIKTRCTAFTLKPLSEESLFDLLDGVAAKEAVMEGAVGEKILELCAKEAGGSPRQALSNLEACMHCATVEQAAEALRTAAAAPEAFELARLLSKGASWPAACALIGKLKDDNPESIRQVVRAYFTKVALGSKSTREAEGALAVLDAFSTPFHSPDGITPVLLAVGRILMEA